jgi:amidohydrolase
LRQHSPADKLTLIFFHQQPQDIHPDLIPLNLLERARSLSPDLIAIRRDLHRHPELSFKEVRTAGIAAEAMKALGFDVRTGVGQTGVVADLDAGPGPVVALRADMDALPIQETNEHDFVSTTSGVMHACGHDGHVAGLIGAARLLASERDAGRLPPGRIRFLFQPSEERTDAEGLSGAMRMVSDGAMDGVDAVVGLHIGGPLPSGKLFFAPGPIMAGAEEVRVEVRGKSSHAALPNAGVDALVLAAQGVVAVQQAVARGLSPMEAGVVTFGRIEGGTAHNIIADRVTLEGTIRFFSEDVRARLHHHVKASFEMLEALGAKVTVDIGPGYLPVINDARITECVRAAAIELVGEEDVLPIQPMTFAEDFSFLAQKAPGTFFWVGAALPEPRMHHEANFDIDESALPLGAATLAAGAVRLLREIAEAPDTVEEV